jgi:chaperonin cofactor prefoldin
MAKTVNESVDEIIVDFSRSSQKKTKRWALILSGLLSVLLVLGFTLRTPPQPQLPTLTKVNEAQETSMGSLYYIGTTYASKDNQAESLYYLDAPQTDSALTTKVTAQIQTAYGELVQSKVYQAGAHTFAITYHPDKENQITTQQLTIRNLSKVEDGDQGSDDVISTVVKPDKSIEKWTPPTFKTLVLSGLNYKIERLDVTIKHLETQIEQKNTKIDKAKSAIEAISDQDKINLTSEQLNANQTQLDALNSEVEAQTTSIQTLKSSLETQQSNRDKAKRILQYSQNAKSDEEIAKVLG